MNWFQTAFKQLFGISDKMETDEMGLPKVSCNIPMPKVKPPKADKDISEPIISFVKCVQENPKRFKVIFDYEPIKFRYYCSGDKPPRPKDLPDDYFYHFEDKETLESWALSGGCFSAGPVQESSIFIRKHTRNPEWLTKDERVYLINSIKTIFKDREGRKERVAQLRKERRVRAERNRLKGIYCDS